LFSQKNGFIKLYFSVVLMIYEHKSDNFHQQKLVGCCITPEFLSKVEERHGKPQVSKIGGRLKLLLPTFTTHPTTDAIQRAS
jgi:hypothetical protein